MLPGQGECMSGLASLGVCVLLPLCCQILCAAAGAALQAHATPAAQGA
jgi:hypothetical protein